MRDGTAILEETKDTLGIDAYRLFPDSRLLIPDAVLWGLAATCVGEFIKGFVDFKTLGEGLRHQLDELLRRWHDRDGFAEHIQAHPPEQLILSAIKTLPARLDPAQRAAAQASLAGSLRAFGLADADADRYAQRIASSVDPGTGAP